jgi:hypothetical protein
MRTRGYLTLAAILVIAFIMLAGCTTTQTTGTSTPAATIQATSSAIAGTPQNPTGAKTSQTSPQPAGLDTTINVHHNDFACIDVQAEMGVVYLFPDQKFLLEAAPPNNQVNVNILFLDVTDNSKLLSVTPTWNAVSKVWEYPGIVPIVQFNDLNKVTSKTITIKNQGKYFLCADDRKEIGASDAIYRVSVRMTPAT